MLHTRFRLTVLKSLCMLGSICFAAAALLTTSAREIEGYRSSSAEATAYAAATAPSGKANGKIVFSSDRQGNNSLLIWTMNPDGSNPTQLTFKAANSSYTYDGEPRWSPDGNRIAFRSYGRGNNASNSIYMMNADGSNLHEVIIDLSGVTDFPEIGSFDWSPDGTRFVFDIGAHAGIPEAKLTTNIFIAGADGKNLVKLTHDTEIVNGVPRWSPDGKTIAFLSNSQNSAGSKIQVMAADGSNRRTIANGYSLSWSPDGSKILFVGPIESSTCPGYACSQLYTVKPDGSSLTQLTNNAAMYGGPKYSPDGTKIVFEKRIYSPYYTLTEIFVMNADGTNQINICNRPTTRSIDDAAPDWQSLAAPTGDPPPGILGFSERIYISTTPTVQIVVKRDGGVNQIVSCDYQIRSGEITAGFAGGTLTFAAGAASTTISFTPGFARSTYQIDLFNNSGNATFIGGILHATIIFAPPNYNPIDNSAYFLRQQYRDFFGREPDSSGWDFWMSTFDSCREDAQCVAARSINTSAAFFLSIEFQQTGYLVERIYKAAYGDAKGDSTWNGSHQLNVPTTRFSEFTVDTEKIAGGLVVLQPGWEQKLESNKQAFFLEFVQRPRFTAAFPDSITPEQYVDRLNHNAANVLSPSERAQAITLFGGSTFANDKGACAQALRLVAEDQNLSNAEFNRAFVLMQYFGYLRRNPDDTPEPARDYTGYDFWLTKLNQLNGNYIDAEMVKAFISSTEYRQRFGP